MRSDRAGPSSFHEFEVGLVSLLDLDEKFGGLDETLLEERMVSNKVMCATMSIIFDRLCRGFIFRISSRKYGLLGSRNFHMSSCFRLRSFITNSSNGSPQNVRERILRRLARSLSYFSSLKICHAFSNRR